MLVTVIMRNTFYKINAPEIENNYDKCFFTKYFTGVLLPFKKLFKCCKNQSSFRYRSENQAESLLVNKVVTVKPM